MDRTRSRHSISSLRFGQQARWANLYHTCSIPPERERTMRTRTHVRLYGHISPFTGFAEHLIVHLEVSYTKGFFGRISLDYFGEVLLLPSSQNKSNSKIQNLFHKKY